MVGTMLLMPLLVTVSGQTPEIKVDSALVTLLDERQIPALEAGALKELLVKKGSLVKEGDTLGRQEDDLISIERERAVLDHEIARVQSENDVDKRYAVESLKIATQELKRSELANGEYANVVSKTEIERLLLVVKRSELQIEQADRDRAIAELTERLKSHDVDLAQRHLDRREIRSPFTGQVVQLLKRPGEWLAPGDSLVRIIRLDRLSVQGRVDSKKYGDELKGCPVEFKVLLAPENREFTFKGKVTFVDPELDKFSGKMQIEAELDNDAALRLKPGHEGTLIIHLTNPASEEAGSENAADFDPFRRPSE